MSKQVEQSDLVRYAKVELERAGLFDKDSDYNGMIGKAALELVEKFSEQGHSGFSASLTLEIAEKLLRYEPLTPLTYEPDEWIDQSEASGRPMWQNKRKYTTFSTDGGKTHYDLDDQTPEALPNNNGSNLAGNTDAKAKS